MVGGWLRLAEMTMLLSFWSARRHSVAQLTERYENTLGN